MIAIVGEGGPISSYGLPLKLDEGILVLWFVAARQTLSPTPENLRRGYSHPDGPASCRWAAHPEREGRVFGVGSAKECAEGQNIKGPGRPACKPLHFEDADVGGGTVLLL